MFYLIQILRLFNFNYSTHNMDAKIYGYLYELIESSLL
jgi:hypothetical protein